QGGAIRKGDLKVHAEIAIQYPLQVSIQISRVHLVGAKPQNRRLDKARNGMHSPQFPVRLKDLIRPAVQEKKRYIGIASPYLPPKEDVPTIQLNEQVLLITCTMLTIDGNRSGQRPVQVNTRWDACLERE